MMKEYAVDLEFKNPPGYSTNVDAVDAADAKHKATRRAIKAGFLKHPKKVRVTLIKGEEK